ncbi:uncharacterized protein LOC113753997 isoform X1 [Coffea eugenioides]|uniref:uncharacterized protein LOC113753997 isoform X1 n=1 Tax=Coffea eugenioides TaxID=49369 RepID=UPI000F609ACC|nr:uncharacterized protein LOC113753997 isoform X1 [Coffea eugenioides]
MENEDISGGESDWVEVQSPFFTTKAHRNEDDENSVVIKDSFFTTDRAIFPPSNQENLPVVSLTKDQLIEEQQQSHIEEQQQLHPSSSPASLSSDGDHQSEVEEAKVENKDGNWIKRGLGFFSSGIEKIVSRMRNCADRRASTWLFASATTGVGAMLLVVVLYRRAKRWRGQALPAESKQHLRLLIREKDQKINQLLHQVIQLNDMLLARRRVPVVQVA